MRLAKYLAHSGVASRRNAEELIAAGRVRVGGEVVRDPARDVEFESGVEVDGRQVGPEPREVWILNKPAGVTSTAREPGPPAGGHRADRLEAPPVPGRPPRRGLDRADPGHERRRARQPAHAPPLRGAAHVSRPPAPGRRPTSTSGGCATGVELDDGPTAPARVRRVSPRVVEITIREGRNRQVRRMAEAIGNEVVELERVSFGPLQLERASPRPIAAAARRRAAAALEGSPPMSEPQPPSSRLGRARRRAGGAQRRAVDPGRDRGADARAHAPQLARARRLHLGDPHRHGRPQRPVPRRGRAGGRARLGAAALRARDRTSRGRWSG